MPALICVNELSCGVEMPHRDADQAMARLMDLLRAVRRLRRETALLSTIPVPTLMAAKDYSVQEWAGDGRNRDGLRLILAMAQKAPFNPAVRADGDGTAEYSFRGRTARGLGLAHLVDGVAVSLAVEGCWDASALSVTRDLIFDDEGEAALSRDTHEVPHASAPVHLVEHIERVRSAGIDMVLSGDALWDQREDYFPHLCFLSRVEGDVRSLSPPRLFAVRSRLLEMEIALAEWAADDKAVGPRWRSKKADGEHDQRRSMCEFTDCDGITGVFDEHIYFAPRPGRIYFRTNTEKRTATIAWIGRKIL